MHVKTIRYASGDRRSSNFDWEPWVRRGSGICISATTLVSLTLLKFENCRKGQWIKIQTVRGNETRNKHLCTYLEFSTAVKSTLLGKTSKNTIGSAELLKMPREKLMKLYIPGAGGRRKSSKTRMPVPRHYIQVPNSPTKDSSTAQAIIQPCTSFSRLFFFPISLLPWPHLAIPCSFSSLAHLHRDYLSTAYLSLDYCHLISSLTSPQNCFPFDEYIS